MVNRVEAVVALSKGVETHSSSFWVARVNKEEEGRDEVVGGWDVVVGGWDVEGGGWDVVCVGIRYNDKHYTLVFILCQRVLCHHSHYQIQIWIW